MTYHSSEPRHGHGLAHHPFKAIVAPDDPIVAAMPRLSPHRVFSTSFARAEVYQPPVPLPEGITPAGPPMRALPARIRETRTHAADVPIPESRVPCAAWYPKHPVHDEDGNPTAFDPVAHDAFRLLRTHGDEAGWAAKIEV